MKLKGRTLIIKVRPFLILFFCLSLTTVAMASQSNLYIQKANDAKLSDDPFWRSLLHFKGAQSQILSNAFFLSKRGKFDAKAELEATIDAYFSQRQIDRGGGDKNIVCIYPARYMWLNDKLGLPGYHDTDGCPALSDWARLNEIGEISVIYVSGYLGNPASSFGHVLLNFKVKNNDNLFGLSDTSISYGATVSAHDNVIAYILKGLFGGYKAGFSDKFFYTHDQVYSSKEFRDMWEYTLNLGSFEKKMLIYHVAELLTMNYRYFFLNANCAHRIAVLLDIFIPESVYNHDYPIYVPEELFHRLNDIDIERKSKGKPALIKDITYIPSARRQLYYETTNLSLAERHVFRDIVKNDHDNFHIILQKLDDKRRINVLNAVLTYQYYKLMASDDPKANETLKRYKDKILLERLLLPIEKEKPIIIPKMASPKDVSPPSSFNTSLIIENNNKPFTQLGVTVFRKESIGLNTLEYNELVALDLSVGYRPNENEFFIDRFDFIKIKDFKTLYIQEANENPMSWRVRAGIDRYQNHDIAYDYELDGGIGLANKIGKYGIYYGFLNGSGHTLKQHFRTGPSVGIILGNDGPVKLQFEYAWEVGLERYAYRHNLEGKLQYQINKKNAVQLFYEKNERDRAGLSYIYYW